MDQLNKIIENSLTGDLDFINTNDIIFEEGNLGIPVSLIARIYTDAWRSYRELKENDCELSTVTKLLLLFNPECQTFWNDRRKLVKKGILNTCEEYRFTSFLLTKYASKGRIWDYRLWLLRLGSISEADVTDPKICNITADRYKCNYPSWGFRRMQVLSKLRTQQDFLDELEANKLFIKAHISDSSGWSYRQAIIFGYKPRDIKLEAEWTMDLIQFYPKHESIWNHLRFLCLYSNDQDVVKLCITFASGLRLMTPQHFPLVFLAAISKFRDVEIELPKNDGYPKFLGFSTT